MITPQPTISIHTLDMEPTKSEPICIKMEDLECLPSAQQADAAVASLSALPLSSPTSFSSSAGDTASSTPAPSTTSATPEPKPAKKRKSWGQVLPEPKTNLPPRKRAKTEDEKEQRRIERVRRNRLAAHNSRERKRVEVENLLGEKNQLELVVRRLEETVRQQALYIERLTSAFGISSGITAADMAALPAATSTSNNNGNASTPSSDAPTTPMSRSASSGFVGTPTLSSISSPDSAALPLTPETKPVGESELAQHSAVSLGLSFEQSLKHLGGMEVGNLDPVGDFIDLPNFGTGDFTLFTADGTSQSQADLPTATPLFANPSPCLPHLSLDHHDVFSNPPKDLEEYFGDALFAVQPGSGATFSVSDGPGIAAEGDGLSF